jgi:hydroxyacylglutathione hydrolase
MIKITPIPAFSDNYLWIITNNKNNNAYIIDPGDAKPVIDYIEKNNLNLTHILITHHHHDHIGGLLELKQKYNAIAYGPNNNIKGLDFNLKENNIIKTDDISFKIIEVPGHTLDHIAYYISEDIKEDINSNLELDSPKLFCGDTLFSGGCGRLFEGTPEQMFKSLEKLAYLPDNTKIYCAHEYTLNNLKFAESILPNDKYIQKRILEANKLREQNIPTIPTSIKEEKLSNIFLRSNEKDLQIKLNALNNPIEAFAKLRKLKDDF